MPSATLEPAGTVRRTPLRPHELLDDVTPAELVPVLAHFGVPRIDAADWHLSVDGLVRRPRQFSLTDLKALPAREIEAFLCCAGNPLAPAAPTRRIANVVWGGVDLRDLLDAAGGAAPGARFAWSSGVDAGAFGGVACGRYAKDLPCARIAQGDVLVATALNGEPLAPEHGFPARLVVPGWYGTNGVKWLTRICLADHRLAAPFTTRFYTDPVDPAAPDGPRRPVWAVAPESVIVHPAPHTGLVLGEEVEVWGRAWAGAGVRAVEVSTDDGASWRKADLASRGPARWAWRRFRFAWTPREAGAVELMARATGLDGGTQPRTDARNAIHAVPVLVHR